MSTPSPPASGPVDAPPVAMQQQQQQGALPSATIVEDRDGSSTSHEDIFPVLGLLPKQETQAWDFLMEFPQYDGRGVKVAIFDTGVDPAASGLQVCPDGRPKIVDIVDCSGSGDVDTSTVVKADAVEMVDGVRQIKGLSGRTLKLNPKWANPSGEWRIGLKRGFELFPKSLVTRVKKERRKEWDKSHLAAEVAVARELSAWREAHPTQNPAEKKFMQDLEARAAFLEEIKTDFDDPGPLHDCVVWKGIKDQGSNKEGCNATKEKKSDDSGKEEMWWAAVDTKEDGDLSEAVAMTDFDKLRQHARFSDVACMNFGVHLYDGGDVLSIVVDAGAHGTHVAGIVSAFFPDDPEANGVAPGAQIVSLKIGDSRLGSMETGTAIVRAVTEAVRMGCDVINMSYGEAVTLCDSGRVVDIAREAVCKHGIVFVASAGNNGPCLSTSGAPGSTTPLLLSVGGHASPSLMSASFSLREELEGGNFTWTSNGPTPHGDIGVSVMAPGGAIAPVPNWTLQKKQLMMGTSMASPNCAGVVSLLLSGMKQKFPAKKLSAHRVRRALENSAKRLPGLPTVVQGQGLVQTSAAFEYLIKHVEDQSEDIQYKVALRGGNAGVYLRQAEELSKKTQWDISVKPVLHEDEHNDKRAEFEMRFRLSCDEDWVECSSDLELLHSGREFAIAVDPRKLPPGLHCTSIEGYDVAAPGKGPMFRVPLAALVPVKPDYVTVPKRGLTFPRLIGAEEEFGPGKAVRRFLHPPAGATWMDVEVKDCREAGDNAQDGTRRVMVLHCLQLLPHTPYRDADLNRRFNMNPGQKEVFSMRVAPCAGVEVCLAQNWNTIGKTSAEVGVTFRGVVPSPDVITLRGGSSHAKVIVSAPLSMQEVAPSAFLTKWRTTLVPSKSTISALGQRDITPDKRQTFALLLEYSFKQLEAGDVTPRLAALNEYLYDSAYDAQMHMIFDSNKKLIAIGDCWPESVKLSKGEYSVRVQVRHSEQSMLKKLKNHPLEIVRKISPLNIPVHKSMMSISTASKPGPAVYLLDRGESKSLFFSEPLQDKLPKGTKPGDLLTGLAFFVRNKTNEGGEGRRPGGYPVYFTAGPVKFPAEPATQDSATPNGGEGDKKGGETPPPTETDKLLDALRDVRVKHLESCKAKTAQAFQEIHDTVSKQIRADGRTEPDTYLPLLLAKLHFLDRDSIRRGERGASKQEAAKGDADAESASTGTNAAQGDGGPSSPAKDVAKGDAELAAPVVSDVVLQASPTGDDSDGKVVAALRAVVAAADHVIENIDQAEVAMQLGTNVDAEDSGMVAKRKDFDDKKKALADSFARKARALSDIEDLSGEAEVTKSKSPFLAAYSDLLRWAEISDDRYAKVALAFLRRKKRLGMMVKLLTKLISSSSKSVPKDEASTIRAQLFSDLGWDHLVEGDKTWAIIGKPRSFPLF